ncbi:transglutaminase-like domain-containing protein [Litoreibacter albidus]|uniref:Transglutaminase-like enzyme, putative cysteine protease n=1 Tax=Litoreibacter albidus TaxID=670155 RepID=A0A1H3BFT6_9RHOB|nr:transglutaminase family protein [Litoreibacter albidus]SDX40777.1 Transglutaminase-like enzyme, putative cysteine protease [Litoreibacter albidus]
MSCIFACKDFFLLLSIQAHLIYTTAQPCALLLQIEAAQGIDQRLRDTTLRISPDVETSCVDGEEQVGTRRWVRVADEFDCSYQTQVAVDRHIVELADLAAMQLCQLPSEVTKYLMPSRYCHPEDFLNSVPALFGAYRGGALIEKMSAWIKDQFTYNNLASHGATTATDSFGARAGVCRDYAHVLIAMARAVGIPARFVSAYAPDVSPQDFHAVAEVYLEGQWHLVDPTGMAKVSEIARIGVGRDAADVSFMTSYGQMTLKKQAVTVSRCA